MKKSQVNHKGEYDCRGGVGYATSVVAAFPLCGMSVLQVPHSRGSDPLMKQTLRISTWTPITSWFKSGTATICYLTQWYKDLWLPACPPTCLPAYLPACPPTYLTAATATPGQSHHQNLDVRPASHPRHTRHQQVLRKSNQTLN